MAKRVNFARINRREDGETSDRLSLVDEIKRLVDAKNTIYEEGDRRWVITDLELDAAENFATGILAKLDNDVRRSFDEAAWSMLKGERIHVEGGSEKAMAPFAVDLREGRRWVAFIPAVRLQASSFPLGAQLAFNRGLADLGLPPWEVDLLSDSATMQEWILEHPDISVFRRTVRRPNPGRDLSDELAEMKELAARTLQERYTPGRSGTLRAVDMDGRLTDAMRAKIDGVGFGNVDVYFEARGPGGQTFKFSSKRKKAEAFVQDFEPGDFERAIELCLGAVQQYSARRASEVAENGSTLFEDGSTEG